MIIRARKLTLSQVAFVLILFGIVLTFRDTLSYFFVQDDFNFLSRLAHIQNIGDFVALLLRNDHFYRPMSRVVMLSIPFFVSGTAPLGYHLFNMALHILNSILVYRLLRLLGFGVEGALAGMTVYGLYPAHFTPLSWVSGIQELSVAFYVLVSAILFLMHLHKPFNKWLYPGAIASYLAALLSKEVALLLPLCLLTLGVLPIRGLFSSDRPKYFRRLATDLIGFAIVAVFYLWLRSSKADVSGANGPYIINLNPSSIWNNLQWYVQDLYGLHGESLVVSNILFIVSLGLIIFSVIGLRVEWYWLLAGSILVAGLLFPSLILDNRHYSYYFSVPAIGVSVIVAAIGERLAQWILNKRFVISYRLGSWVFSGLIAFGILYANLQIMQGRQDEQSLKSKGERAQQVIVGLLAQQPVFLPDSILYVVGVRPDDESILGSGSLFTFYYPILGRVMLDSVETMSPEAQTQPNVYVYRLPSTN
jgi:hypothetical protein